MCGICGEIFIDNHPVSLESVKKMKQVMEKRGPDSDGLHKEDSIVFGHRRLKIIDLSEKSSQPMIDRELGLSIVFNGAIYNYPELRKVLQEKGYNFTSTGDTEVILKAYHAWGESCVKKFNGMFAFAIYNNKDKSVFLARDRLGIKPLYHARTPNSILFASSLPAIVATDKVDSEISPEALHYYLTFHAVVPAPKTLIKGIEKLPPATCMKIDKDGGIKESRYWQLSFHRDAEEKKYSFDDWKEQVVEGFKQAVRRRLVADVPVGVLLSGGLDSSLVVGLLAQSGQKNLKTFSIGFESVGGEKGDEFQYSDIVADYFATDHNKIEVDARQVLPNMEACVKAMSEPMVSHDCIGFYLLSREVAKHVKVVQSGQGADEIFAGYHWYPPMMESHNPVEDYRKVFGDRSHEEFLNIVSEAYRGDDYSTTFISNHFALPGAKSAIDKTLRMDSTIMLVDDPVKRVDNMTMAWSLEARVPFLDHEFVELSAKIPSHHKVSHGGKHILKEAARRVIPNEVIDRPKGYFPVPALKYLQGEYLDFVKEIVSSQEARKRGIIKKSYIDRLLDAPQEHITPLKGSKLWQIALLEYWLQLNSL
ncbi:Asparagine synthase family amidotransferase [Desulfamplus magnetovallimortis]|uniref:asparagine synthase (glutamine-hydrolyzing) n=1 Tax=Desulfamplus magnetovallimortis TaxID=1246637 RepID=A0A1W1HJB3_9BACT|nr:N-acetylglutaminylglutamine amidotransferase [Desulfamplus magnetovallimortis]SLM32607.1 Asparagine synthase family amidotransferase [Desulfamplus magnetovallimortis]